MQYSVFLSALSALLFATMTTAQTPIRINMHIIGFDVDVATETQLRNIAAAGDGRYYSANNEADLNQALGQAVGMPNQGAQATQSNESEANNSAGKANPIAASGTVAGTINPLRDHDWYRFDVPRQGRLKLRLSGPTNLDLSFRLFNADIRDLSGWRSAPGVGADNEDLLHLKQPGTYYLEIADGHDDAETTESYTLTLEYQPGDDFEPNNRLGAAAAITPGQDVLASINPQGDHDWYAFTVDRQGTLDFLVTNPPDNLDVAFRLFDDDGRDLTGWRGARRVGGDNDALLALTRAGLYRLELADGSDDASAQEPYTLRTTFYPGDDYEPNPSFGQAAAITLGADVQASINPDRDHDWYRFTVPNPGKLDVLITDSPDNLDIAFRLFNADGRDLTGWRGARRMGGDNDAILELPEAGDYLLELADGSDNASSPQPYTLRLKRVP